MSAARRKLEERSRRSFPQRARSGLAILNARRFVSEYDVGRLAAGRTIEVVSVDVAFLPDRASHRGAFLPVISRHIADATAEVPRRRRSAQRFDPVDVADA